MDGRIAVGAAVVALLLPLEARAQNASAAEPAVDVEAALERIRSVTEPFRDIAAARSAGYPLTNHCVASAAGGMGHHFVNEELMDDHLEVDRPEILVYAPTRNGDLELAGVEYVVPYSARGPEAEAPRILGQSLKRADGLRLWYLHVWVWNENPNGVFADWNPKVVCPQ